MNAKFLQINKVDRSNGSTSTPAEKFVYHGQAVQVDLCRQAFDVLKCI
jgi:hypothetical protein